MKRSIIGATLLLVMIAVVSGCDLQQTAQQAVERGVSGFGAIEDSLELRAQDFGSLGARSKLVFLQLAIEPPDHPPRDLDGLVLDLVGGDQLVDGRRAP